MGTQSSPIKCNNSDPTLGEPGLLSEGDMHDSLDQLQSQGERLAGVPDTWLDRRVSFFISWRYDMVQILTELIDMLNYQVGFYNPICFSSFRQLF